jgi:hypothetical protein
MPRTATCPCGNLKITVSDAEPKVHACSCLDCQKRSGSSFSYTAFYPGAEVIAIEGERKIWQRTTHSGKPHEDFFCPTCGGTVFVHLGALPGIVGINIGCFADPDFAHPQKLYWSSRRHGWLGLPDEIATEETQ